MKIKYSIFLFLFIAINYHVSSAQNSLKSSHIATGNGTFDEDESQIQCMVHLHEKEMKERAKRKRAILVEKGILPPKKSFVGRQMTTSLHWPLRQANGFNQFSYYRINNYVDLDPASNAVLDYACGSRTYDSHKGMDIDLWPFWWKMTTENQVEVVAAAPGIICDKRDGQFDLNCDNPPVPWNAILVEHADGSMIWYGHLKNNSLTSKPEGAAVVVGEYLGLVASSGNSSHPHLHFEVQAANGDIIEPHFGVCNPSSTWWANQKPYWEPTLNHLQTHSGLPIIGGCPGNELPLFKNNFEPGDGVWCAAYYHDEQDGQTTTYTVKNPLGIIIHSWSRTAPYTASRSWGYSAFILANNALEGTYTFNATYQGATKSHHFMVGCPTNLALVNQPISPDIEYQAANTITTSGSVAVYSGAGTSIMHAGNYVSLNPGFTTTEGMDFRAFVGGCQ